MGRFDKFKLNLEEFPEDKYEKKNKSSGKKYLRPGLYEDIYIIEVEDNGESKTDPTWINFNVKFEVQGKILFHLVQVPTDSLLFGPKRADRNFKNLQRFCKAIGLSLDKENVEMILPAMFSDPKKLIGLRVNLVLGYDAYYSVPENGKIIIRSRDDKPVLSEDGVNPLTFPDFIAAKSYCENSNMQYSQFIGIKWVNAPKTANDANILNNLLKPEPKAKKASTCPF